MPRPVTFRFVAMRDRVAAVRKFLGTAHMAILTVSIAALSALGSAQVTGPAAPHSPPHPVAVVELFTSEGCSSCPPADALLRRLADRTENGTEIIVMSEHVTYWNRLGWTDPFSSDLLTNRQSLYADRFHLDSVYTPQIVVNGRDQVLGSDEPAVLRAIHRQPANPGPSLRILSVYAQDRLVHFDFVAEGEWAKDVDLFAALVDDTDTSQVARGENSGRTLTHAGVVRNLTRLPREKGLGVSQVVLALPRQDGGQFGKPRHVILLAQSAGQGSILTAATAVVPAASEARRQSSN